MRVAIYSRVSTVDQETAVQVEPLKKWIEALGYEVGEVFEDTISGRKSSRPELDRLLALCEAGEVEAVAIVKLDRLARSTRHLLQLSDQFQEWGVDLLAKDQQINTSTPSGKLLFTLLGAIGEFEAALIAERTKAGLEHARSKGKVLGRPKVLELTKVDAQVLIENHGSISGAARARGVSRGVIRRALAQELCDHSTGA